MYITFQFNVRIIKNIVLIKKQKMENTNYQIIADEQKLQEFIDWLPDLDDNETFYVSLFARKKYANNPNITNDKAGLKRLTTNKERLVQKLRQLEIKDGCYLLNDNIPAPNISLAPYIMPNPRCIISASFSSIQTLASVLKAKNKNFNLVSQVQNCIQKAKSRTVYVDFDYDFKSQVIIDRSIEIVGKEALTIIETRGGYHVLVEPSKVKPENQKIWHNELTKLGCDQSGDQLLPIVGCYQGGFIVRFVEL